MQSWKEYAVAGSIALSCVAGTLSLGDALDVNRNYATPLYDDLVGIETAEGFAPASSLDLETLVNDSGRRETYLEYRYGDYTQRTPVNDVGYAEPGLLQRLRQYFNRREEDVDTYQLEQRLQHGWDEANAVFDYYVNEVEQFVDKHLGGE